METNAIDQFANRVLDIYHQNKEEFWSAVMAPFLSDTNLLTLWQYRKIGLELMNLLKSVDEDRKSILAEYTAPLGFDINDWKSLKQKEGYYKDAYPVYAFLAIWMDEAGLRDKITLFSEMLHGIVFGIAGYGILDVLVDGTEFSPVELLTAQKLIAEYETRLLKVFGVTQTNLDILHHIRDQFLKAEIKEKSLRKKASPYRADNPIECGFKAAHLLTPFMMSLEQLGKSSLVNAYFEIFFKFGAVIQIIDDIDDLEEDLSIGHFSYVTLGTDAVSGYKKGQKPKDIAKLLLSDKKQLMNIHRTCKTLIADSNDLLKSIDDPFLARIVLVTELRLDSFFRKDLKLDI